MSKIDDLPISSTQRTELHGLLHDGTTGHTEIADLIESRGYDVSEMAVRRYQSPHRRDRRAEVPDLGQAPPIEADAVYNQPFVYALCSRASPSGPCPKIDTDRAK